MNTSAPAHDYNEIWKNVYGDIQETGPVHRHLHRIIRRLLRKIDYSSFMDVGCGSGQNFEMLQEGKHIERCGGIDISDFAISKASEKLGGLGQCQCCDIQKNAPSGVWDLVYCSLILEHLPDDVAALKNMRKMTGKYLLAATIAGDFDRYRAWDERVGHVRNYTKGELERKLQAAGFNVIESIYWGFPFYTPLARTLQNHSSIGTGRYGMIARILAFVLYGLYFLNSSRRGDLLIVLAEPVD